MASAIPNSALVRLLTGDIDLNADDIRARLCMTNTTCDTEIDAINDLADYTTIDPADATGYADVALASEAVTADDTNDRICRNRHFVYRFERGRQSGLSRCTFVQICRRHKRQRFAAVLY